MICKNLFKLIDDRHSFAPLQDMLSHKVRRHTQHLALIQHVINFGQALNGGNNLFILRPRAQLRLRYVDCYSRNRFSCWRTAEKKLGKAENCRLIGWG